MSASVRRVALEFESDVLGIPTARLDLEPASIGVEDLNDGVRLNIRPFMVAQDLGKKGAGILRGKPNIKWGKDRGKEPQSLRPKSDYPWFWYGDDPGSDPEGESEFTGNRWNDVHLTLAYKNGANA